MARIRSSGTSPEATVAVLLRRAGIRFTRKTRHLPGRPDFILLDAHKVVMVHGCFWHQHTGCREGRVPASNVGYWKPKLERNVRRDAAVAAKLRRGGWGVLLVWECHLKNPAAVERRLSRLAVPRSTGGRRAR